MSKKLIGKLFYIGVISNETMYIADYSKEMYMEMFLDQKTIKFCEYKVKLVNIKKNSPNEDELCYYLEVIEILSIESGRSYDNKVGDKIYAYANYKYCDKKKKVLPFNPRVEINDGGTLNCWGCYGALLVQFDEYEKTAIPKLVTVQNRKILVEIFTYTNNQKKTFSQINSMELDESDEETNLSDYNSEPESEPDSNYDYSNKIFHLHRKCKTFGFINTFGKFIELTNSDNYIAYFLSNYLK